jgi:DNA-binding NarL/FixJ family response regulator
MIQTNRYDLVILDLIMPKMTGFQVLENLQSKKIQVKVLVASNLGQEQDIQKAKALGAIDYFIKSDTPISKIVENVSNILK